MCLNLSTKVPDKNGIQEQTLTQSLNKTISK